MTLVTDLFSADIIDEQDAAELQRNLNKQTGGPGTPLDVLYLFFESKVITRPSNGGFFISIAPLRDYQSQHTEAETLTYRQLLDILFNNALITEVVYQKLKPFPLPGNKYAYFGALYLASELTSFYQYFTIEAQLEFAQRLNGRDKYGYDGMIDHRKKDKLLRDIKAGKLETYLDFFKYSFCCRYIKLDSYLAQPQKLLKKLAGIFNELCYNAFAIIEIRMVEDDFAGEPTYDNKQATLLIDTGARTYQHTYTFSVGEDRQAYKLSLILDNLLTLTNKILADYTCSYRFTSISSWRLHATLFPSASNRYAICRLEQANIHIFEFYDMERKFLHTSLIPPVYRFPLSYPRIEYAIFHFKACGLLAHLSAAQLNEITGGIYTKTYDAIGDLLVEFPGTIAMVKQNVAPGEKPYLNFLQALNQICRGVLNFTDIIDGIPANFDDATEDSFNVQFICNNKQHQVTCKLSYKYFDTQIIYYVITEIIRKDYPGYQLIQLISGQYHHDYFLFASKQQNDYLLKMKLREAIDRF
ncbi:hypothetical protein [Mucilaginibacter paludis]|uniref:Uncharacterized protein n=1 Tax=Mucilaginibacter paludis DSM 18603 TaxID=714943 RepID=H1Y020_9SPHI|nr:hypothetical protein [Mucilaginibacter paludis]EHQ27862.1 hypothetical protein Mucpa_3764 [Mucilaginibacter paludis DSM 18603]